MGGPDWIMFKVEWNGNKCSIWWLVPGSINSIEFLVLFVQLSKTELINFYNDQKILHDDDDDAPFMFLLDFKMTKSQSCNMYQI